MTENAKQEAERPRRRHWVLRAMAAILVLLLLTVWLGPIAARPILQTKLQSLVSSQLNAELRIGSLRYSFPYGIDVTDAGLVAKDDDGRPVEVLTIPRLEIGLAKLPFGDGPLVISRLRLHDPAVQVIHTDKGFVGRHILDLGESPSATTRQAQAAGGPRRSEMFELRLVEVTEGRIVYEDKSLAGTVPMVWQHIDIKLTTDPANNPLYDFNLALQSGSTGSATAAGRFHIDDLDLNIRELAAKLTVAPHATRSPAPPEIQQIMRQFEVHGTLEVNGTGRLCPESLGASSLDVTVALSGGHVQPDPDLPALDGAAVSLRMTTGGQLGIVNLSVLSADAAMGPARLVSASGRMTTDLRKMTWAIDQLDALFRIANLAEGDVKLRVDGSGGALPRPNGRLNLHADSAKLLLLKQKLLLTDLSLDAAITPEMIETVIDGAGKRGLHAALFGGSLNASASVRPHADMRYELPVEIAGVDLQQLSQHLTAHGGPNLNLAGTALLSVKLEGTMPQGLTSLLNKLGGSGRFEINNARLYELKSVTDMAKSLHLGENAGQFREAAGLFTIAHEKVSFSKLVASSASLGLQGSGTIGFDGQLDLRLVAALLEDWRGKLKKTGIPLIGNVLGEMAGSMQKLINTASANLLSQFHVHGSISNPQVTPEPAPLLTDEGATLFGKMIQGTGKLLE